MLDVRKFLAHRIVNGCAPVYNPMRIGTNFFAQEKNMDAQENNLLLL